MAAQTGAALFGSFNGTYYPTPLAYVPIDQVHQLSVATYLHIGTTAVLIWDVVDNLRNDYRLFFSFKFGIPTFIYCVTRLSILAYAIGRTVMLTTPAENCVAFEHSLNAFLIIFLAFTTLFFYIRVCVVYMMNPYIVSFFGLAWLATAGMTSTLAQTFRVHKVGPYCYEHVEGHLLVPTVIVLLVNEIFVYIAVTYKVYSLFLDKHLSVTRKLKLLTFGTSFPVLSSVILQDSQLYCLVIVLTKAFLILTLSGLKQPTNVMFIICHIVLVNILSCRVYRNIRMSVENWEARNGTSIEFRTSARNAELYQRRDGESISSSTVGAAAYHYRSSSPDPSVSRRSDLGVLETVPGSISDPSFHERTMNNEKYDSIYVVPRHSS